MSESEHIINQVIVRKAGGYNLKSVDWWKSLSHLEQETMLNKKDVQFFASGSELDPRTAAAELSGTAASSVGIAVSRAANAASSAPVVEWPPLGMEPTTSKYTRRVVEGPRWLVTRTDDSGQVELHILRGHDDASVYDLARPSGALCLSNDLLLDAIGYPAGLEVQHPKAFEHFKSAVFDQHLGNRPWEVAAAKLRATFESNPYLKLVSPAASDR
jgi:hypothetical protein